MQAVTRDIIEYDLGLPARMQSAIHTALGISRHGDLDGSLTRARAANEKKFKVLDGLLAENVRVSVKEGMAAIYRAADQAARDCYAICDQFRTMLAIKIQIWEICKTHAVPMPIGETDTEILKRALDKSWWIRNISKEHKRRLEHTSIQLGLTGKGVDAYISREVAMMQKRQNTANARLLRSVTVTNGVDKYTLAELAELGMANKTLRRGELMTRIRGFEEIATELNHAAMFWTITCPSKYHSVGGTNDKYNGATPRQAQKYLSKVWARIRAVFNREGIRPYGFRIAEPHTDGCPHWHMLFFVDRKDAPRMEEIIQSYAMREDGDEKGAAENRVKLVHIETKHGGSAAGYIVKYISKNIDGNGVGDHKVFENGETYKIESDLFGQEEITPSQRVTYWSQVWGIRQFQQIGGAPVGVWRELRRVPEDGISQAPYEVQEAWNACQKTAVTTIIDSPEGKKEITQASFADYLRAQGGVQVGRAYRVKVKYEEIEVVGKYATYKAAKPCGIYAASESETIYKSKRYVWTRVDAVDGVGVAVAFGVPRTGVNNCTPTKPSAEFKQWQTDLKTSSAANKNKIFSPDWMGEAIRREKGWDLSRRYNEEGRLIR